MGAPFPIKPNTVEITRVASRRTPAGHATGFELLVITAGNYLKELGVKTAIGYSKPHMVDVAKKFLQLSRCHNLRNEHALRFSAGAANALLDDI